MSYALVLSTVSSRKEAFQLAAFLLNEKLAACVNVSSRVNSLYWWKGKIEKSAEYILFIKTKSALLKKLEKAIRRNHSYSLPEVIVLTIRGGSVPYLRWIGQVLANK